MEPLPVDKGWAWVICFESVLTEKTKAHDADCKHEGDGGDGRVKLLYQTGQHHCVDLTGTAQQTTVSANVFLPKFGERKCVIFGGILTSLSSIGQGLSTHVAGIIVLEGLRGTGHGILFVPAMCLIRQYFKRLRSTASVIVFCGGCVAAIVAPFIIAAVSKEYGVTGTYLLLGAVELHYCVSGTGHGILFVPAMCLIRQYFKRLRSTASVIVFCGGCVAAIVAPFIIAAVSKEYGVTGTYLLLGAVELHYCVSGLLLRPVTSYRAARGLIAAEACKYGIPECLDAVKRLYKTWMDNSKINACSVSVCYFSLTGVLCQFVISLLQVFCVILLFFSYRCSVSPCYFSLTGVLCQFVGFFSLFETLIVYVILLGLVIGARVSLLPLVVIEVVGVDKMPQAFSIISLVATITAAGVNPLFGAITEATGSFIVALHIVGACFCFGAAMWILVPRLVQLDIKKGRRD
uniref:Major facilitator superfamily (MFS) profile domain-containing protein n=1 Tax=Biomphalaria glabrata TaxID=6526 RepID=A0A2C9L8Q6_BIOGL